MSLLGRDQFTPSATPLPRFRVIKCQYLCVYMFKIQLERCDTRTSNKSKGSLQKIVLLDVVLTSDWAKCIPINDSGCPLPTSYICICISICICICICQQPAQPSACGCPLLCSSSSCSTIDNLHPVVHPAGRLPLLLLCSFYFVW